MAGGKQVSSRWNSDGNLEFLDNANNVIFTVDGVNRKLTLPTSSELEVVGNVDIQAQLFDVYLADGQDETSDTTIPVTGLATGDKVTACLVLATKASIATTVKRAASDFSVTATNEITVGANPVNNTNNQYVFFVLKA